MHRSIAISALVAATSALVLGVSVLAAGGGGFGSPGTTSFSDVSASAYLSDSTGATLFLYVDRGVQSFKLRGVSGPPVVTGPGTVLNYSGSGPDGSFFSGCYVIPDSRFTVASNLSSATLAVDSTVETPCPGLLLSPDAGGRPGIAGAAPDAGGGGGGFGQPITANLAWTSNGAVTSFDFTNNSRCQTAVAHANGSSQNTFAAVSGSVSLLTAVSTEYAAIDRFATTEVTSSQFSDLCTGA